MASMHLPATKPRRGLRQNLQQSAGVRSRGSAGRAEWPTSAPGDMSAPVVKHVVRTVRNNNSEKVRKCGEGGEKVMEIAPVTDWQQGALRPAVREHHPYKITSNLSVKTQTPHATVDCFWGDSAPAPIPKLLSSES